jgi:hypothetical protein
MNLWINPAGFSIRSTRWKGDVASVAVAAMTPPTSPRIRSLLRHPLTVLLDRLSPRRRLLRRYASIFGHRPRLDPPVGYNEHITHRLLHDRDPRFKIICDKIAVKKLVADRVGPKYTVPLLGAWRRAEQIPWDLLPESFVLKPNQTSGPFVLVESRGTLDLRVLTAEVRSWLRRNSYVLDAEWGYAGIPRSIMAEPLLRGPGGNQALEIYVDTFQGRAAVVRLLTGRKFTHERRDAWFDVNGRQLALKLKDVESLSMKVDCGLRREVVAIAEAVSAGMSSLRIDFLVTAEGPRVVELTAYPCAGRALWEKPEMDEMMGRFFDSPDSSFIPSFAEEK